LSAQRLARWCGWRRGTSWHTRLAPGEQILWSRYRSAVECSRPFPQARSWPCCTRSPVRGLPRPAKTAPHPNASAIFFGDCYATTNFLDQGFGRTRECSWRFMPRCGAHLTGSRLIIPNPFCTLPAPMMRGGALREISVCSQDHFAVDPARRGVAEGITRGNGSAT